MAGEQQAWWQEQEASVLNHKHKVERTDGKWGRLLLLRAYSGVTDLLQQAWTTYTHLSPRWCYQMGTKGLCARGSGG